MESVPLLFEEFKVYKKYNFLNYIRIRNWLFQNLQEIQRTRFSYYIIKSWWEKFYLEALKFSKLMHSSLLIFLKIKLFEKRDIKHENYFKNPPSRRIFSEINQIYNKDSKENIPRKICIKIDLKRV